MDLFRAEKRLAQARELWLDRFLSGEDPLGIGELLIEREEDMEDAVISRAKELKNIKGDIDKHKQEERRINLQRHALESLHERLKLHIIDVIETNAIELPIKDDTTTVTIRKNPPSVSFTPAIDGKKDGELLVGGRRFPCTVSNEFDGDLAICFMKATASLKVNKTAIKDSWKEKDKDHSMVPRGIEIIVDKRSLVVR